MESPNCYVDEKKLDFPPRNNLIPKNFSVLPSNSEYSSVPKLLKQWEDTDLWYKKDDKWKKPKAIVTLKIYITDERYGLDKQARLFTNVWLHVQGEYLREFAYTAGQASLSFSITGLHDNLNFSWSGFNDTMPVYIKESLERIMKMKEEDLEDYFDQVKEKLLLDWKNVYYE